MTQVDYRLFAGTHNVDVMMYHKASGSLMTADLIFNLPGTEQYTEEEQAQWGSLQKYILNKLKPSDPAHQVRSYRLVVDEG